MGQNTKKPAKIIVGKLEVDLDKDHYYKLKGAYTLSKQEGDNDTADRVAIALKKRGYW